MIKTNSWKDIFQNFLKDKQIKDYSFKSLLKAAGHYNSKSGGYKVKEWIRECRLIENKISLKKKDKLLEIGSGSGALLKYFSKKNKIYGADYSIALMSLAKKALPNCKFSLCEANKINFNKNFFHAVVMQSCIQYFPNEKYFLQVMKRVKNTLKKNGKLFIGEIVDEDNLENFIKYRKKKIGLKNYKLMYLGNKNKKLKFFSISKNNIISILKKDFKDFEIYNCPKRGDEKDYYRFNLVCTNK